jgi:gluconokinase
LAFGFWVIGGAKSNGGNLLTWLRDRIGLAASIPKLADLAFGLPPALTSRSSRISMGAGAALATRHPCGVHRPQRTSFVGRHGAGGLDGLASSVLELAEAVESVEDQRHRRSGSTSTGNPD